MQFGRGFVFPCNVLQPRPRDNGIIHCTRSRGTERERGPEPGGSWSAGSETRGRAEVLGAPRPPASVGGDAANGRERSAVGHLV